MKSLNVGELCPLGWQTEQTQYSTSINFGLHCVKSIEVFQIQDFISRNKRQIHWQWKFPLERFLKVMKFQ